MDGPEQGHTQATDPAAASKDTGAIEPVIKGKHQKKKKKEEEQAPSCLQCWLHCVCISVAGMEATPLRLSPGHIPCHSHQWEEEGP